MKDEKGIRFVYTGRGGEFLHGIPARDLSEDDWAGLTKEQQEMVQVSRLYKEVKAEARKDQEE